MYFIVSFFGSLKGGFSAYAYAQTKTLKDSIPLKDLELYSAEEIGQMMGGN